MARVQVIQPIAAPAVTRDIREVGQIAETIGQIGGAIQREGLQLMAEKRRAWANLKLLNALSEFERSATEEFRSQEQRSARDSEPFSQIVFDNLRSKSERIAEGLPDEVRNRFLEQAFKVSDNAFNRAGAVETRRLQDNYLAGLRTTGDALTNDVLTGGRTIDEAVEAFKGSVDAGLGHFYEGPGAQDLVRNFTNRVKRNIHEDSITSRGDIEGWVEFLESSQDFSQAHPEVNFTEEERIQLRREAQGALSRFRREDESRMRNALEDVRQDLRSTGNDNLATALLSSMDGLLLSPEARAGFQRDIGSAWATGQIVREVEGMDRDAGASAILRANILEDDRKFAQTAHDGFWKLLTQDPGEWSARRVVATHTPEQLSGLTDREIFDLRDAAQAGAGVAFKNRQFLSNAQRDRIVEQISGSVSVPEKIGILNSIKQQTSPRQYGAIVEQLTKAGMRFEDAYMAQLTSLATTPKTVEALRDLERSVALTQAQVEESVSSDDRKVVESRVIEQLAPWFNSLPPGFILHKNQVTKLVEKNALRLMRDEGLSVNDAAEESYKRLVGNFSSFVRSGGGPLQAGVMIEEIRPLIQRVRFNETFNDARVVALVEMGFFHLLRDRGPTIPGKLAAFDPEFGMLLPEDLGKFGNVAQLARYMSIHGNWILNPFDGQKSYTWVNDDGSFLLKKGASTEDAIRDPDLVFSISLGEFVDKYVRQAVEFQEEFHGRSPFEGLTTGP